MEKLITTLRRCRNLCMNFTANSILDCCGAKSELDCLRTELIFALSDAIKSSEKIADSVANSDHGMLYDTRTVKEICRITQLFDDLSRSPYADQCPQITFSMLSRLLSRLELLQIDKENNDLGATLVKNYDNFRSELRDYIMYTSPDNDDFALVDMLAVVQKAYRLDHILSKCYSLLEDTENEFYQRFSRAKEYMYYIIRHADRLRHNNYDDKCLELVMFQEELGFLYSIIFDGAYFIGSSRIREVE